MMTTRLTAASVFLLLAMLPSGASAQQIPGCTSALVTNPPRTVFRCRGGLLIEAEASASFAVSGTQAGGTVSAVELRSGGVLVELTRRRRFQILTPHAIASVRGTIYAVDATATQTSVFVARGRTRVARRDASAAVELRRGQGVDVTPGQPLTVRRWSAERAGALLARFGRRGPGR